MEREAMVAALTALDLRVIFWTQVRGHGSIPRTIAARNGEGGIVFRIADAHRKELGGALYDFDGWEAWLDGPTGVANGGRFDTIGAALGWYRTAMEVRDGRANSFLGGRCGT